MIASALIQTALLLSSGAFNALLNPGSLSVEKQLFVSSVILIIGFAQGVLLLILKVVLKICTGFDVRLGSGYLLAPLTTAMKNRINERPGETDMTIPIVVKTTPRIYQNPVRDIESDEEEDEPIASHFLPEQEMVIEERRNVFSDVYILGLSAFTATYCIDSVSPAPTAAFISGLLVLSITQSVNIMYVLARARTQGISKDIEAVLHGKRILTVSSCMFVTASFLMFCIGLAGTVTEVSAVENVFDVTFSVILPLVCPWLLVTVSPKQVPVRTLMECAPFVLTLCMAYILFFLATRGSISTIIHEIGELSHVRHNDTMHNDTMSDLTSVTDLEFHSYVNASIHFNTDIFSKTSVDSAGNIPLLMVAPLLKIPTIVVVLANVINRSHLLVITSLLIVMSARQISDTTADQEAAFRAYCVTLVLSVFAFLFNIAKYTSLPPSLFHTPHRNDGVSGEDMITPPQSPTTAIHVKDFSQGLCLGS
jgi:hypothetical protein